MSQHPSDVAEGGQNASVELLHFKQIISNKAVCWGILGGSYETQKGAVGRIHS